VWLPSQLYALSHVVRGPYSCGDGVAPRLKTSSATFGVLVWGRVRAGAAAEYSRR
jgi:hypothetical protein